MVHKFGLSKKDLDTDSNSKIAIIGKIRYIVTFPTTVFILSMACTYIRIGFNKAVTRSLTHGGIIKYQA